MEQLPRLGTAIHDVVGPTFDIYKPLLRDNAGRIRSTPRETFAYGADPRQQLDLYTPSSSARPATSNPNSVLIFLYGGGFVNGDKIIQAAGDGLVYANIGHYFTDHLGIPVIIIDYRLIRHGAEYPSGAEDLKLAIDWTLSRYTRGSTNLPDLYIMGNSAGAVHTAIYLLAPEFASHRAARTTGGSACLKAVILVGAPLHFEKANPYRRQVLDTYFGADLSSRCPVGLIRAAKANASMKELSTIRILLLTSELDPEDEILIPNADFVKEWQADPAVASDLSVKVIQGHNHISPVLSLGTGIAAEEAWGKEVVDFICAGQQSK